MRAAHQAACQSFCFQPGPLFFSQKGLREWRNEFARLVLGGVRLT